MLFCARILQNVRVCVPALFYLLLFNLILFRGISASFTPVSVAETPVFDAKTTQIKMPTPAYQNLMADIGNHI